MLEVRELVKTISKEGMTVFLSSHLLFEVEQICDHVTIINKGSVLVSDTLENVSHKLGPAMIHIDLVDLSAAVIAAVKNLGFVLGTWKTDNTLLIQVNTYTSHRALARRQADGSSRATSALSRRWRSASRRWSSSRSRLATSGPPLSSTTCTRTRK